MKAQGFSVLVLALAVLPALVRGEGVPKELAVQVQAKVKAELPALVELYKHLHEKPELSLQ